MNESEKMIAGTLLLYPDTFTEIQSLVTPEMFKDGAAKTVARWVFQQADEMRLWSVALAADTLGGNVYDLAASADRDMLEEAVHNVRQRYFSIEDANIYMQLQKNLLSGMDFQEQRQHFLEYINQTTIEVTKTSRAKLFQDVLKDIEEGNPGDPTCWPGVDELTGGDRPGEMIIVAARPGMGKTHNTLNLAYHKAKAGKRVLFISLEMTAKRLVNSILAQMTGINKRRMQSGQLTEQESKDVAAAMVELYDLPLFIHDMSETGNSLAGVLEFVRSYIRKEGITHVIIDYMQLLHTSGSSLYEETTKISNAIASFVKKHKIAGYILSQLSRANESRGGNKKPMLSDLRQSGSIEQDADAVLFIYRPAYYGLADPETGETYGDFDTMILLPKNREFGDTGEVWISGPRAEKPKQESEPVIFTMPKANAESEVPF